MPTAAAIDSALLIRHHWRHVLDAYAAVVQAAGAAGVEEATVKADVRALIAASRGGGEFVERVLGRQLAE